MFRHRLAREVAVLIACKLVLLIGLYVLFFSPAHRPTIDADRVGATVYGAPVPTASPSAASSPAVLSPETQK